MYITAVYAAISALLVVALSFRVIRLRLSTRTGIGDGGHQDLARCIRAHANAVEYLPLALLLLLLVDADQVYPNRSDAWLRHRSCAGTDWPIRCRSLP